MNADCRELRPLLSAYMDNYLTPDEVRAVQVHVAGCPECAAILQEYRQLRTAVRSLAQPMPPPELRAAVFAKATPAYRRRAMIVSFGQRGLSYAALAAAVIAIFLTAALLLRSGIGPSAGAPDTTPPQIVTIWPQPGEYSVNLAEQVRITFSEPMDQESVRAALSITADPPLSAAERQRLFETIRWDGNTLLIGGTESLQPYTNYSITIDPRLVRDRADNTLRTTSAMVTTFQTVDVAVDMPTPAAIVAVASAAPPTATVQPSPTVAPTQTPRHTEPSVGPSIVTGPPQVTPTATTAAPVPTAAPSNAPPIIPTPTQAPPPPAPTPTPTIAPPTATPQAPTATPQPTSTPAPSPTAQPTATSTPMPTAAPSKSPFAVAPEFAAIYQGDPDFAERVGLPTANSAAVGGSYLVFEHGWMLWRGDSRTVYVLFNEDPLVWYAFADGWVDGMEPGGGPAEKAGLYRPMRGFGKIWAENPEVQRRLGFALAQNETGGMIAVQQFERGLLIASDLGTPSVYALYQNNLFERIAR